MLLQHDHPKDKFFGQSFLLVIWQLIFSLHLKQLHLFHEHQPKFIKQNARNVLTYFVVVHPSILIENHTMIITH